MIHSKIIPTLEVLRTTIDDMKSKQKKIVLCQGHFNVIHPGHLRFLEFAKSHGDYLLVALHGEQFIEPSVRNKFFTVNERTHSVASLVMVDGIFVCEDIPFDTVLEEVKPHYYVMGEEFARKDGAVTKQITFVEQYGGEVIFSSGEIRYNSTELLEKDFIDIKTERMHQFKDALIKQQVSIEKLFGYCDICKNKHILVIGDTIVDQYVACDALGMSSEAPVLVVRELEQKEFVGGAAVVARHVRALGAECSFLSVIGNDEHGRQAIDVLQKDDIHTHCLVDADRPTTFKIRYMVGLQKMLRVSKLKDHHIHPRIQQEIIEHISHLAPSLDAIIMSDFSYGIITPSILGHIMSIAQEHDIKLFGDSQSSSQVGNVLKFQRYYCLTAKCHNIADTS